MAFYKCPDCKVVFSVDIFVDPLPLKESDFPPMPCPNCGHMCRGASLTEYIFGKKIKKK